MKKVKKPLLFLLIFSITLACNRSNPSSQTTRATDSAIENRIKSMSIEQKVGQMTQINIDVISKGKIYNLIVPHQIDSAKLDTAINKYFVGSILNAAGYPFSRKHWKKIITNIQTKAVTEGSKTPILYGIDAIHGANYTVGATLFPQQIGLAATWNTEIVEEAASITAYDVSASGIPWNFSPVLDLARQPLWGRFFETFGEDVYLAKTMGKAFIKGYQGKDVGHPHKVAACLKHYVGYSYPLSGKDRTPAWIPDRMLKEYFLPTFKAAIDEGALSIMVNSGEVNGIPVHANKELLTTILRDEYGFEGIVLTDWEDIIKLYKDHHIASDMKEAVYLAINAGIDMSMTPNDYSFNDALIELVKEGRITESRLDESVRRILTTKQQLGLLENPYPNFDDFPKFGSEEHTNKSLQAAKESITLVKNQNILPLSTSTKILVTGPGANSLNYLNGGWTHTWQGDETKYNTIGKKTIQESLKLLSKNITYMEGSSLDSNINTAETLEEAENHDVIVVCLAEDPATEGPADINSLDFPKAQQNLVKELSKSGKPIVVITTTARPRIMREIEPLMDAILLAYLPGNEGGTAIAETILGLNNPSGKLPFTYPKYQGLNITYDHKHTEKTNRFLGQTSSLNEYDAKFKGQLYQWDFGYGLSYSNFIYSNLKMDKKSYYKTDTLKIEVTVTNQSEIAGDEVIQIYCSDLVASITPCVKRLRGFKKTHILPNQSKTVKLSIAVEDLAFVGSNNKWIVESGEFKLKANNLTLNFEIKERTQQVVVKK
ncbi:MAG: beta-glucosidase [Flavobacteriales bacterium]|jgi:beta-glucosidase|tara:strand:- start:558 stop:2876 length:2319 start_codon:yes stop_codon:yes gene_type:complete